MTQISDTQTLTTSVIADLQARRDYSSVKFEATSSRTVTGPEAVASYDALNQALITAGTKGTAVPTDTLDTALALTAVIINANTLIQKMGQLNTNRTIEPGTAKADNVTLASLNAALMTLKAGGDTGDTPTSPTMPTIPDPIVPPMPDNPVVPDDIPDIEQQYP